MNEIINNLETYKVDKYRNDIEKYKEYLTDAKNHKKHKFYMYFS